MWVKNLLTAGSLVVRCVTFLWESLSLCHSFGDDRGWTGHKCSMISANFKMAGCHEFQLKDIESINRSITKYIIDVINYIIYMYLCFAKIVDYHTAIIHCYDCCYWLVSVYSFLHMSTITTTISLLLYQYGYFHITTLVYTISHISLLITTIALVLLDSWYWYKVVPHS